ncbi:MAG: GNAT family N-acetyltransferase [Candidatus Altiarchaeia archaeon]
MPTAGNKNNLAHYKKKYPGKFASEETAYRHIRWGDRILIGSGCGEPQHLLKALIKYVKSDPKALLDAEVFQIWAMGDAPYADETLQENFRHNSFFIGKNVRDAVNKGLADYTPVSLSDLPDMFRRGLIPLDVSIIQVSPPDKKGCMSLGISVDIVKAAVENSSLVIAQVNRHMPRTCGDGFIRVDDVDYLIPFDEPLLEYKSQTDKETAKKIQGYLSRLVHDGETIQAGYGSLINSAVMGLAGKKNLGIHTEMLSDALVSLIKKGAVDNSKKTINRGQTIASFCMGARETYRYLDNNARITFKTVDYTDNPLVIARHHNMTAINSALGIDLTGQASEESVGKQFYGGIGGQASFMRGAALSKNGKSILVLESTADNGKTSRITPFLPEGAGVTLNRGDVHYVVTEYGIAYLHGKNIRERAMELIGIAHPKFRGLLIEEAKKLNLIYGDQEYISGNKESPDNPETYRTTWKGLRIKIRPVRISDESLLKEFFYSLTDDSLYRRFASARKDMPHDRLQCYTVFDHDKQTVLLALLESGEKEELIGIGQYNINGDTHMGDVAFVVRDDHQHLGVGSELLKNLTCAGIRKGLMGFTAEVLSDNEPMKTLFKEAGFKEKKKPGDDMYEYALLFRRRQ